MSYVFPRATPQEDALRAQISAMLIDAAKFVDGPSHAYSYQEAQEHGRQINALRAELKAVLAATQAG